MTLSHPDPEHLTTIFVAALATNTEGLDVGHGEAPDVPTPEYPYLVVSRLGAFSIDGDLKRPNRDQNVQWQVTSVGLTSQQAEGGLGAARDTLIGTKIDFTAASYAQSGGIKLTPGPASGRDAGEEPTLFLERDVYKVPVSPT